MRLVIGTGMSAPTAVEYEDSDAAEKRRVAPRTFLMLAATARYGGTVLNVRIRNVSETGALIEGDGLPQEGESIRLSRGETEIDAVIAWASGFRRGLHFSYPIPVDTWRAGKPVAGPPSGQGRVDLIQASARAGHRAGNLPQPAAEERWIGQLDLRMGEELAFVQRLIETLGDGLVADPAILQRHGQALQNIDLASQILGHLSRVIAAPERAEAVRTIGMEDLRARLTRHRKLA
jgi:hypothetical protein